MSPLQNTRSLNDHDNLYLQWKVSSIRKVSQLRTYSGVNRKILFLKNTVFKTNPTRLEQVL